jgi:hypothetical protein
MIAKSRRYIKKRRVVLADTLGFRPSIQATIETKCSFPRAKKRRRKATPKLTVTGPFASKPRALPDRGSR